MVNTNNPGDIDPERPIESIAVPSDDPVIDPSKKKSEDAGKTAPANETKEDKEARKKEEEMNEEDLQLKNELEMLVERLKESSIDLYLPTLNHLRTLIKTSTSSMTSVPKPLKFLRPFYGELIGIWEGWEGQQDVAGGVKSLLSSIIPSSGRNLTEERSLLASIISVLAMTYSDTGNRDTLHYRILSRSTESPGDWGHEYVRHLAAEIGEEYAKSIEGESGVEVETEAEKDQAAAEEKAKVAAAATAAASGESSEAMAVDPAEAKEDRNRPEITSTAAGFASMAATSSITLPDHILHPKRSLKPKSELLALALECVPFFLSHNAEADAVDLLMELESIELLDQKGFLEGDKGEAVYARVCQYMISCVPLLVPPDDKAFLKTAASIYASHGRYPEALALAVRVRDRHLVRKYFEGPTNVVMKKQLAFFLARAQIPIAWLHCSDPESYVAPEDEEDHPMDSEEPEGPPPTLDEELLECLGNIKLSEHFRRFAKELDVMEPRSLEDVYKSHLETGREEATLDSARANLAGTFVNAFVNAGYGNDKLVVDVEDGQSFIYKNKADGMMSATASLGLSMLWDTDVGVSQVDKYTYSAEEHIKAGALLALGILHNGVRAELDVAYALLEEHVDNKSVPLKIAAINGIALACVGSCRQDIADKLLPYVADDATSMEVSAMAALALGYVFVGSGNGDVAISIVQTLMERAETQLGEKWARFMGLALGLVYLGKQEASEATLELLRTIEHPLGKEAGILVDICSYAGTGNVLKIQTLLHHCSDHEEEAEEESKAEDEGAPATDGAEAAIAPGSTSAPAIGTSEPAATEEPAEEEKEKAKKDMTYQAYCVIGIALVAMGEEVGAQMSLRQFGHLMVYGDPIIRKSVPLALGLISASNPQLVILESLSRYSHDTDLEVAANAILAMGLVGAGTNNARLAQMLRQLSTYYAKEANCIFMVRVAQGLVHMGKGTIGINPFFHDRTILSPSALSGLLSLLVSFVDAKSFVLDKSHWMLYWLVTAMYPQFLITLDEELNEKPVTVRVGQAVNTVGLAGQRMGISGFQTHSTPVRIAVGERAEFGTNEFFPYASQLENIVIMRKNPGYDAEDMQT